MNIARAAIDKALLTWILVIGCLLGGLWGFNSLGRLEDPAFTIKTAVIVTHYPGPLPNRWRWRCRNCWKPQSKEWQRLRGSARSISLADR